MRARARPATRVAAWTILLLGVAFADGPLDRAEALAGAGQPEEAAAAYAEALSRADLSPQERADARYHRGLLLERELGRIEEALEEYRRYLEETPAGVLPRTTRVVVEKVWDLESALGPDGEIRQEIARFEAEGIEGTLEDVHRLQLLLRQHPGSRSLAKGYLVLGRLCMSPGVADWKLSLRALDLARAHGADLGEVEDWRWRARLEFRRSRIHAGCVAFASLLLSATLCLTPWRSMRREDWVRALRVAVPGLALAAAWAGLWFVAVRKDPESPITPMQGPVLIVMAVVVLLDSMLLAAVLRGRRLARVLVPLAALLLSLAGVGVFCGRFDYFPLFGL